MLCFAQPILISVDAGFSSATPRLITPDHSCKTSRCLIHHCGLPRCLTQGAPEACTSFITYTPSPSVISNKSHQQNLFSFDALVHISLQVQFPVIKSSPTSPASAKPKPNLTEKDGKRFQALPRPDSSGRGWPRRYLLPNLLKHEYVALRFVVQASYEKAARMCVTTCVSLPRSAP